MYGSSGIEHLPYISQSSLSLGDQLHVTAGFPIVLVSSFVGSFGSYIVGEVGGPQIDQPPLNVGVKDCQFGTGWGHKMGLPSGL
jgi:hypothetical protein